MEIINELNKNQKNRKIKQMRFIEDIYPLFILNSIILGYVAFY